MTIYIFGRLRILYLIVYVALTFSLDFNRIYTLLIFIKKEKDTIKNHGRN